MRNAPHKTDIAIFRETIEEWRKREGWSRETVCQQIVEAHERIDGPAATGIHFDPPTRDTFERQKVNAERIFRWLDDVSKDKNLLPANFQRSIRAALPMDLLLACQGEILRPAGLDVSSSAAAAPAAFDATPHLAGLIKESAEASQSLLLLGADAPLAKLESACKEIKDVEEAAQSTARALLSEISRRKNGPRCASCKQEQGVAHAAGCKFDGLAA